MSDEDELHGQVGDRLTATIAMSQTSARLAYAVFLSRCPETPRLGTSEHKAMLDGKDATLGMALTGLHAEHKHGTLKHLTPDDMTAIGEILTGLDTALSRRLGVDIYGRALQ